MKKANNFSTLLELIKEDKKKLIIASILIFICGLFEIFTGYLNGAAVESITKLEVKNSLIYLGIYFVLEITAGGYLYYFSYSMLNKIENKISRKLGYKTYQKALNLPAIAYEQKSSGEIINRITNDTNVLKRTFSSLLEVFTSLVASLIIIVYVFFNSWIIGVEILFFVMILFFFLKKYNPKLKEINKERKIEQDKFTSSVTESVRGVREIKTLGIKSNILKDVSSIIKNLLNKTEKEIDIKKYFEIRARIIKALLEVGVFATCVILIYNKQISLTFFIAMTYYIYRYAWLIENINSFTQLYQDLTSSLERINEILENKLYEDEKFGDKKIKNVEGVVEFKNIDFSYPNEEKILSNFNLKIKPKQKVAIVGASGQGKSTIFNLLTRIFDSEKGQITIDGINIKELDEYTLRTLISVIRQEPFIFNKTIKENFKTIKEDITLDEIRKYTKMAYLDEYIMSLPKQYDTVLGEGGVNLSGGQKQRLSIARTLSKQSKIILFDEATSALDNQSQDYIKKTINNLIKDHTVILIAHRLSTIIDADIIHVMDKGKIIASGTHKKLLKNCETYRKLYEIEPIN